MTSSVSTGLVVASSSPIFSLFLLSAPLASYVGSSCISHGEASALPPSQPLSPSPPPLSSFDPQSLVGSWDSVTFQVLLSLAALSLLSSSQLEENALLLSLLSILSVLFVP